MSTTRAVVVGAASGIGAALVARHRAAGHETVSWDVTGDCDLSCDITDPAAVAEAAARTLDELGPPSMLTVTAGIGHGGMLRDVDPDDFDRMMGVNVKGVWLVLRAFQRAMRADRDDPRAVPGSMVATSSVSAQLADRTMGLYCASKAALDMVVRVAALEWAPGVRVNAVAPGVTDTPMLGPAPRTTGWLAGVADRTALGRLGTPDDIAEAILAVHAMPWVTGQVVVCDGGLSLHSPIDPLGPRRPRPPSSGMTA